MRWPSSIATNVRKIVIVDPAIGKNAHRRQFPREQYRSICCASASWISDHRQAGRKYVGAVSQVVRRQGTRRPSTRRISRRITGIQRPTRPGIQFPNKTRKSGRAVMLKGATVRATLAAIVCTMSFSAHVMAETPRQGRSTSRRPQRRTAVTRATIGRRVHLFGRPTERGPHPRASTVATRPKPRSENCWKARSSS